MRGTRFPDGQYIQDNVIKYLHSFTYEYIDLDVKVFYLDKKKINILITLAGNFSILKPDKGITIVIMKCSDYICQLYFL